MTTLSRRGALTVFSTLPLAAHAKATNPSLKVVVPATEGSSFDLIAKIISDALDAQGAKLIKVSNINGNEAFKSLNAASFFQPALLIGHEGLERSAVEQNLKNKPKLVGMIGAMPSVLVTRKASFNSLNDLVAYGKTNGLTYANAGHSSPSFIAMNYFGAVAGLNLIESQEKGGLEALHTVMSGKSHVAFLSLPVALNAIKSGEVKALAIASPNRNRLISSVPTFEEAGYAGFNFSTQVAVYLPQSASLKHFDTTAEKMSLAMKQDDVGKKLRSIGVEVNPASLYEAKMQMQIALSYQQSLMSDRNIAA